MIGLYNKIKNWKKRNFSYQFLINPETIGSLCFLHSHGKKIKRYFNSGLVLTCLGGSKQRLSYKLSKSENSSLDKIFKYLSIQKKVLIAPFNASSGSDERQYNSPGFNFPVGNISRYVYGDYSEYHNSGDDKKFMRIKMIEKSVNEIEKILQLHDYLLPIKRYMPFGEIMFGKRNLIANINIAGNKKISPDNYIDSREKFNIIFNILGYADGNKTILDIAELQRLDINKAIDILNMCLKLKLIKFI